MIVKCILVGDSEDTSARRRGVATGRHLTGDLYSSDMEDPVTGVLHDALIPG